MLSHSSPRFALALCYKELLVDRGKPSPSLQASSRAAVLLSELERLYESYGVRRWGRSTFPGAEPPAGPPKLSNSLGESTFPKNLDLFEAWPNTSIKRDFSKTHRQTQRMHSWIGLDLTKAGKLLRSQLNSQILRYLHFSEPFTPIFDKHV